MDPFSEIFGQTQEEWAHMFDDVKEHLTEPAHPSSSSSSSEPDACPSWITRIGASDVETFLADLYTERMSQTELGRTHTVFMVIKKAVVRPEDMDARQYDVYCELLRVPNLIHHIVWMNTQSLSKLIGADHIRARMSGRVVDSLMTKFPRFSDVHYYIDVTDREHTVFVPRAEYSSYIETHPSHRLELFNISSAYRSHMGMYSKTFFDPFQRGVEVMHPVGNKMYITFSMCRLKFFMWAKQHHVFDFLKSNYVDISRVQREDQYRQRAHRLQKRTAQDTHVAMKTKRKFRVVTGALCPSRTHPYHYTWKPMYDAETGQMNLQATSATKILKTC